MDLSVFAVALQSSFLIGLIHGINPCGHSWLMLAPFVSGERRASRVAWLTFMFLAGTSLACIALGLSLGSISGWIPQSYQIYVDWIVNGIIIVLGAILVIRPEVLHNHDHDHDHGHCHVHGHEHHDHDQAHHHHDEHTGPALAMAGGCCGQHANPGQDEGCCGQHGHEAHDHAHKHHEHDDHAHEDHHDHDHHHDEHGHAHDRHSHSHHGGMLSHVKKATGPAMFGIGFVNMIVPCPTAAIMFKYSIESGDPGTSAMVFGSYAVGTAVSVGLVIAGLYKAASWMRGLQKPWLEGAIMRTAGVLIVGAGVYSLAAGA